MADNSTYVTKCFMRDTLCPHAPNGEFCRAWDGKEHECLFISLLKDFMKPKMTVKHPDSAPPPEVRT